MELRIKTSHNLEQQNAAELLVERIANCKSHDLKNGFSSPDDFSSMGNSSILLGISILPTASAAKYTEDVSNAIRSK